MESSKGKNRSKWATHQQFKNKAKNRVDDLQGMFTDLQQARKENRVSDVAILEEQVHQMLREWKAELHEASPASSLLAGSLSSSELSFDMKRLLQLHEEDDDASSSPKPPLDESNSQVNNTSCFQEDFLVDNLHTPAQTIEINSSCPNILLEQLPGIVDEELEVKVGLESRQLNFHEDYKYTVEPTFNLTSQAETMLQFHDPQPGICPPPAAFLGPKCALWDCPRPAQGSEWGQDYCSNFHGTLALNEGAPGMTPVLRPRGIDLKDGPLFAALSAKTQEKAVGIPECEGAATSKSPWNAHELFDIRLLQGESIREWLFFDKPRRAFESGTRKQRSLPDYNGRGWHESRKQVMKDLGGLKRSYYMDPQPSAEFEWHLYEYEMNDCDACALYRLELKHVGSKKNIKGRIGGDPMVDLEHQIGRLYAELSGETKRSNIGRIKSIKKNSNNYAHSASNQVAPLGDDFVYGAGVQYGYFVEEGNGFYETQ
eukprot:Gb_24067 [translate_table: standard]